MKTVIFKPLLLCIYSGLILFGADRVPAVTFTISPAVISNTYPGFITLNITGLTNTETVIVQRWIDGNANGLVDPGELLMDTFKISDNNITNTLVGGVTNVNVPYDNNSTTGAITTVLNCPTAMIIENMVGHYVYQVVSPTGRFTPATATFTVTNAALSQFISGLIYSNGVPAAYAVVVAQDQQSGSTAGAVVADASGHFVLALPSGGYTPIAGLPNCYYDTGTAPTIILSNGLSATNNLYLTNGTVGISGKIYDSANSNGIGGLLLTLQSGSLFAFTFTDTNGNYSANVTPSFWKIKPTKERIARRAYLLSTATFQVDATAGNVTNADFVLPKATALFYGRIVNNSNAPLPNVELDSSAGGSVGSGYSGKGFSDANGYYSATALGDGTNYWNCSINQGAGYVFNNYGSQTLTNGQTVLQNFIALPVSGNISGRVQDNSGTNVSGVTLMGSASIGGLSYNTADSTTDSGGNYSLGVASGQWQVQFLTGGFADNIDAHGYVDLNVPHYVNVPPTNAILNLIVYPIGTPFITSPRRFSSTQFGFTLNGATNVTYTVQYNTRLNSGWTNLFSLTLTTNTTFPAVDVNATNGTRFYRAVQQ